MQFIVVVVLGIKCLDFGVACWLLWKRRNDVVLKGEANSSDKCETLMELKVVKLIRVEASHLRPLILAVEELLERDWEVRISCVPRETNHVADCLAKLGADMALGIRAQVECPDSVWA
ncbi:hypothetical protein GH714_033442 [Hevea brasiliensis]|uniref:RNase H type-1 domain-containing protein n=1 Tax=Hevea brasiliensis TaxID=3981 RepID=A0A6A6NE27_HEVBR|nr:hypothetical protein GH714_033442 [Hevea brasiliensis]